MGSRKRVWHSIPRSSSSICRTATTSRWLLTLRIRRCRYLTTAFNSTSTDTSSGNTVCSPLTLPHPHHPLRIHTSINVYNHITNNPYLVNNIGPQKSFFVPEGILNYQGSNFIALSLWALDAKGAKVEDVQLVATAEILTGYGRVANSPMPSYEKRAGAY